MAFLRKTSSAMALLLRATSRKRRVTAKPKPFSSCCVIEKENLETSEGL